MPRASEKQPSLAVSGFSYSPRNQRASIYISSALHGRGGAVEAALTVLKKKKKKQNRRPSHRQQRRGPTLFLSTRHRVSLTAQGQRSAGYDWGVVRGWCWGAG